MLAAILVTFCARDGHVKYQVQKKIIGTVIVQSQGGKKAGREESVADGMEWRSATTISTSNTYYFHIVLYF